MTTEKLMLIHPFSDLSRTCPLFFVNCLKQYSINRAGKNFEALRQLIIEALSSAPPPGQFTYVMRCLTVVFFVYESRWGFLCHLFTSVLSRLDKLSTTFAHDSDQAKKLAAKLISIVILGTVSANEAILVKLTTVLKIEKEDLEEVTCTGKLDSKKFEKLKTILETFILKFTGCRPYSEAPDDYFEYRKNSLMKLIGKGWWHMAEAIADEMPELVNLALEMNDPEKAARLCQSCSQTIFCPGSMEELVVPEIRYLELTDFVSEENVIWIDTNDGLTAASRNFAEVKVVGIDSEWIPNILTGKGPYKVSILQIATEKKVFLFDLIKLFQTQRDGLDDCLKPIFHSDNILKLGYALDNDLKQLFRSYGALKCFHFCKATLDLQKFDGSSRGGLSGLTMRILKGHLKKITGIGNWAQRPLDYTQLQYAALDAVVLIAIFNAIQKKYDWRSQVDFWRSSLKDIKKHRESQIQNQNIADITGPPMTGSW